eukprot:4445593-Amphidinium_carterae.1
MDELLTLNSLKFDVDRPLGTLHHNGRKNNVTMNCTVESTMSNNIAKQGDKVQQFDKWTIALSRGIAFLELSTTYYG